jgi:hypothetical protein
VAHSSVIYEAYAGDKTLRIFEDPSQTHNSDRPTYFNHGCVIFFTQYLNLCPPSPVKPNSTDGKTKTENLTQPSSSSSSSSSKPSNANANASSSSFSSSSSSAQESDLQMAMRLSTQGDDGAEEVQAHGGGAEDDMTRAIRLSMHEY